MFSHVWTRGVGLFGQQFDPLVFENFLKFTTKRVLSPFYLAFLTVTVMIATANPSKQTSITMLAWWYEMVDSCFAAWCGVLVLTVFAVDDLSISEPVAKWEHDNYKKGFSNHFHFSLVVICSTGKTYSIGLPSLAIVDLCKFNLTYWTDQKNFI